MLYYIVLEYSMYSIWIVLTITGLEMGVDGPSAGKCTCGLPLGGLAIPVVQSVWSLCGEECVEPVCSCVLLSVFGSTLRSASSG